MFVALWEYEVKPGCKKQFGKMYGPKGEWAQLFRSDSSYIETCLLHAAARGTIYLTLDFWNSRKAYERFMETHAAEYKRLDAGGENLTLRERRIGWFEMVAE